MILVAVGALCFTIAGNLPWPWDLIGLFTTGVAVVLVAIWLVNRDQRRA